MRLDKRKIPKRIGVVFSGGGLQAVCSATATFQVLDEFGIRPAAICGASGGAIGAAMYASGLSGERMKSALSTVTLKDYYDPDFYGLIKALFKRFKGWTGVLHGRAINNWLKDAMIAQTFEECEIPCYMVAININRSRKEVLSSGDLASAAGASAAIPLVYKSVRRGEDLYMDGGAISNVPAYSLAQAEPNLTHILVSSTQDLTPLSDNERRSLTTKPFTPYYIFRSWIETATDEERLMHLDTGDIPNTLMKVRMKDVDFFRPEDIVEGINTAASFIRDFLGSAWS